MVRRRRIEFEGALYHVWTRGNNRQQIFLDDIDRNELLSGLSEVSSSQGLVLYAFCLMSNHFHLLVETARTPLNRVMRRLLTKYARVFNKRHARVGHLFQGRYRARLCEKESYRLELLRYIHLNPVRAGLVDNPADWRWSSHRAYLGRGSYPMLCAGPVLEEFGSMPKRARAAFDRFVRDGMKDGMSGNAEILEQEKDGVVLGSGPFHKTVRRANARPRRRNADLPSRRRRLEDIIRLAAEDAGITLNEIRGSGKRKAVFEAREAILFKAVEAGWSQAEVARSLNCTDAWASQVRKRRTSIDREFQRS